MSRVLRQLPRIGVLLVVILLPEWFAAAQESKPAPPKLADVFTKQEVMIPMRDGVKLHTEIYVPRDAKEPLPLFIERSPYGVSAEDKGFSGILYRYSEMWPDGYIFVLQDIRGRYGSEGQFEMKPRGARPEGSQGDRREHRHLRHHRVAGQERAEEQRARRNRRNFVWRISCRDGSDQSSPGAESGV